MPLKDRLARLANRPHSHLPLQVYAEANGASQLFQYYLLDTGGFQPNVFTTIFPGVNDPQLPLVAWRFRGASNGLRRRAFQSLPEINLPCESRSTTYVETDLQFRPSDRRKTDRPEGA